MASDFISDGADSRESDASLRLADYASDHAASAAGARAPVSYGDTVAPIVSRFKENVQPGDRDIILFSPWGSSDSGNGNSNLDSHTQPLVISSVTPGTVAENPFDKAASPANFAKATIGLGDHLRENPFARSGDVSTTVPGVGSPDTTIVSPAVLPRSSTTVADFSEHQPPVPVIEPGPTSFLTPQEKEQILACFHPRTNMDALFGEGAIAGGAIGAGAWALDSHYRSLSPEDRLKYMRRWEPLSPMLQDQRELNEQIAKIADNNKKFAAGVADCDPRLNVASKAVSELHKKIDASIENGTQRDEWIAVYNRQAHFIEHDLPKATKKVIEENIGTREQVLKGEKLFEANSDIVKDLFDYRSASWKKDTEKAGSLLSKMLKHVNGQIEERSKYPPLTSEELASLEKKSEFLSKLHNLRTTESINNVLGSAEDVKFGRKLFVVGSEEEKLLSDHAKWYDSKKVWSDKLAAGEKALAGAEEKLTLQLGGGAGSWLERTVKGAGRGLLATGLAMGAEYLLDKKFNKDAQMDAVHLIAYGVGMPAVLLSPMAMRFKFGVVALGQGLLTVSDIFNKDAGAANLSTAMRPNLVDTLGATAFGTLPMDWRIRGLGALGTLAVGRLYNGAARAFNWDGAGIAALNGEADEAFNKDLSTKTVDTFKMSVQKEKEVALVTDDAMRLKFEQLWEKGSAMNPADYMRGSAAILEARGEARLEQGSRLDIKTHYTEANSILKTQKYDFGGAATADLRLAALQLGKARNYISTHPGQDGASKAQYLDQLRDLQQNIKGKLDAVYGAHDMDDILVELQKADFVNLLQSMDAIRSQINVSNNHDLRHVAKLARDMAIAELALGSKPNADSTYCDDASHYIALSMQTDPDAPDNRSLQIIAARLQATRKPQ